jgi:hypothetical protein
MTIDEIRTKYSDRILDMLERAAQEVRLAGFTVPPPVLAALSSDLTKHIFWWTDAEDPARRWPKVLQLQFMAAMSEEVLGLPGKLRFSFCLVDLQIGEFLGCRESKWIDRDDPELVEEAFDLIASRMPVLLPQLRHIAEGLRG